MTKRTRYRLAQLLEKGLREKYPQSEFYVAADPENPESYSIFCGADGENNLLDFPGECAISIGADLFCQDGTHVLQTTIPYRLQKFVENQVLEIEKAVGASPIFVETSNWGTTVLVERTQSKETYKFTVDCFVDTIRRTLNFINEANLRYLARELKLSKNRSMNPL